MELWVGGRILAFPVTRGQSHLFGGEMEKHYLGKYDKSSEAILKIMGEHAHHMGTLEQFKSVTGFAQIAWNLTLFPKDQWEEKIRRVSRDFPSRDRRAIRSLLREFLTRKEELYPGDKRFMYKLFHSTKGGGFYLEVATIFPESDQELIANSNETDQFLRIPEEKLSLLDRVRRPS